jgi:hypothetical protein
MIPAATNIDRCIMNPRPSSKAPKAKRPVKPSHVILWVQDTVQVALLNTLESKRGDQGGTDAAPVLGSQDLDGVLLDGVLLLRPVQDFAQGLCAAGLEVGVLVENRSVGTDVAGSVALLLADGGDSAGR